MLVLTRKVGETVVVDNNIEITVVQIQGNRIRLGISAPRKVTVYRKEIQEEIDAGKVPEKV